MTSDRPEGPERDTELMVDASGPPTTDGVAPPVTGADLPPGGPRWQGLLIGMVVAQILALAGQAVAVGEARHGNHRTLAEVLSDLSLMLAYGSALWALTAPHLDRRTRNAAVLCLGLTPTLIWRFTNPLLFTGFDEQLHMRTLRDILSSHRLFEANPLLEVSARYPALEALTTLVRQAGIPTMAAATLVILLARLVLVTVLCDAVEQMTGSARAGGFAVAIYALSSQFVFFNSQFSYQTLAIPLALAAVSLLARTRTSTQPLPLVAGATVCVTALAMTHHATSFLTAIWLTIWAGIEGRNRKTWIAFGACAAIAAALVWAMFQREMLSDYFGPIIDDIAAQFRGGARRKLFSDDAGATSRSLDKYLLIYYALWLSAAAAGLVYLAYRERHLRFGPLLALALLSGSVPLLLAARVVPKGVELYDRLNSFLFFPFSITLAGFAAWFLWREPHHLGFQKHWKAVLLRTVGVTAASLAFLGGYILGSGPNWARLPGPYLPAADTRSMDPETLAAVKWSHDFLPTGSRIAADRVSSVLLASEGALWPVMKGPNGIDAPALYVAQTWSQRETDMATAMRLRYLYVDRRMSEGLPPYGSYFFNGETGSGRQLTDAQLTKFDQVPGISVTYRHGPITIYDLSGLGIPELRSGWYGKTPTVSVLTQVAVGLTCGVFLAWVMRSRWGSRIRAEAVRLRLSWGLPITGAVVLAGLSLISVGMLLTRVWLTPLTFASAASVLVLTNGGIIMSSIRAAAQRLRWRTVGRTILITVPLAVVLGIAVEDAIRDDRVMVREILDDPAAIHVPPASR